MIQVYTGKALYTADYEAEPFRLLVAVICFIEQFAEPVHALVDTASEWCLLPRSVIDEGTDDQLAGGTAIPYSTRFGTIFGQLSRVTVTFDATEGEPLTLETTCFVSEEWPGPMVIGWRGCLERMRFGFDTTEETFYFAAG
jgi:hypothetical protein